MSARLARLDPQASLGSQFEVLLRPRLDEVRRLARHLADEQRVTEHHALRIAVKGLRYELESFRPALPPAANKLLRAAKRLQELLGQLHDDDLRAEKLIALLRGHAKELRATLQPATDCGAAHPSLQRAALDVAHAQEELPVAGLALVLADVARRRAACHAEVVQVWTRLCDDRLPERLLKALKPARRKR